MRSIPHSVKDPEGRTFVISGLIWRRQSPDDITYSGNLDGEWCYAQLPPITEKLRRWAIEAGKSLGEIVDIVNSQIEREEERRRPLLCSFSATLTSEQMASLDKLFGLDYMPESAAERADKVDGTHE